VTEITEEMMIAGAEYLCDYMIDGAGPGEWHKNAVKELYLRMRKLEKPIAIELEMVSTAPGERMSKRFRYDFDLGEYRAIPSVPDRYHSEHTVKYRMVNGEKVYE